MDFRCLQTREPTCDESGHIQTSDLPATESALLLRPAWRTAALLNLCTEPTTAVTWTIEFLFVWTGIRQRESDNSDAMSLKPAISRFNE